MDTRENFQRTTIRIPKELYDGLVAATGSKRSLNAEIIARLEDSLLGGNGNDAGTSPEVNVVLDTNGLPISWPEIHEHLRAMRYALDVPVVSLNVKIITPELVSSRGRLNETEKLAHAYDSLVPEKE